MGRGILSGLRPSFNGDILGIPPLPCGVPPPAPAVLPWSGVGRGEEAEGGAPVWGVVVVVGWKGEESGLFGQGEDEDTRSKEGMDRPLTALEVPTDRPPPRLLRACEGRLSRIN
jgi:hypothetical protein